MLSAVCCVLFKPYESIADNLFAIQPHTTDNLKLTLVNKHRIPITIESVTSANCLLIGVQHILPARKSGYQHQEGRLGQMKIGNQRIDGFKPISGVDEQVTAAAAGPDLTV